MKEFMMIIFALFLWGQSNGIDLQGLKVDTDLADSRAIIDTLPLIRQSELTQIPLARLQSPVSMKDRGHIIGNPPSGPIFMNIFQMMQGRVPGLWVSGNSSNYTLRIRGAQHPPLVVLDDMVFFNNSDQQINSLLAGIPPADVAYIEVLRSIAQTHLYGPGAGNGVILIYTRWGATPEN